MTIIYNGAENDDKQPKTILSIINNNANTPERTLTFTVVRVSGIETPKVVPIVKSKPTPPKTAINMFISAHLHQLYIPYANSAQSARATILGITLSFIRIVIYKVGGVGGVGGAAGANKEESSGISAECFHSTIPSHQK